MSVRVDVKESYFWQQLKAGLEDNDTQLSRVENTAGTGVSDVTAAHGGREAWLELKIFHGNSLSFRNAQRIWIMKRVRCGGRVFVVARFIDELLVYDGLTAVSAPSKPASNLKSFTVNMSDLGDPLLRCGKPFKYDTVRQIIFALPGVI